jgi:hypothetical protein
MRSSLIVPPMNKFLLHRKKSPQNGIILSYVFLDTKQKNNIMKKKTQLQYLKLFIVVLFCAFTTTAFGQNSALFEKEAKIKMEDFFAAPNSSNNVVIAQRLGPNDASGSLMVPTGIGGSGFNLFGGIGGAYPQIYSDKADLGAAVGVTIGDPTTFVNVAVSMNIMDISSFDNFSGNFVVSGELSRGNSISVGALNLYPNIKKSDYAKSSYYVAYSHSVQTIQSKTPGSSRLTYGIGIGSGRFYDKSPYDFDNGKGRHGTAVFANISYEIFQHVNLNAEWTGLNLGLSAGIRPFKVPLNLSVGVTNLTGYTGDRPNMLFSLGLPLSLTK